MSQLFFNDERLPFANSSVVLISTDTQNVPCLGLCVWDTCLKSKINMGWLHSTIQLSVFIILLDFLSNADKMDVSMLFNTWLTHLGFEASK